MIQVSILILASVLAAAEPTPSPALIELCGQKLGVVGDVGGLDPIGAGGVDAEEEELLFGVVDEFARLFGGCLGVGGECHGGEGTRGAGYCTDLHDSTLARLGGFLRVRFGAGAPGVLGFEYLRDVIAGT